MRPSALTADPRSASAEWPSLSGWRRVALMGVMVALPIPLFAASGLAVPLPSIVYRVAVGVAERTQAVAVGVPGIDAVVAGTTELPRRGTIRLSPQEVAEARAAATADRIRSTATSSPADEERARRVLATRPAEPTVDAK